MNREWRNAKTKTKWIVRVSTVLFCFLLLWVHCITGIAADWTTYRADNTRSGISHDSINRLLYPQWTYIPVHPPKPAWPMPSEELPRTHVDNAYHTVIAGDRVFFGSCVTNKIYALDAASGEVRWTFATQGPVRFAPTVYENKIFAGSDDGFVYCLDDEDGSLIWKYRAAPSEEKVIGNGRMISLWPVRTNVLVDDGIVYFAAGVFPYEGLYICALRADDGEEVWINDTIGDSAHELEFGGISPHGYMLASNDVLYVPSSRAMPAAFDRRTGRFLFFASPGAKRGGVWALLDEDRLIAGVDYSGVPHKAAYDAKTGARRQNVFAMFPGVDLIVTREVSYILNRNGAVAINRKAYAEAVERYDELSNEQNTLASELSTQSRNLRSADESAKKVINERVQELTLKINQVDAEQQRVKNSTLLWNYAGENFCSLILAGDSVFIGAEGKVIGLDKVTGKEFWKSDIQGKAAGMAVSNNRLIVSSDQGQIYCYGDTKTDAAKEIKPIVNTNPYPNDERAPIYQQAAEQILSDSGITKGYCLVLDCGEGRLAYELAKRTNLQIIGLEKDPVKRETARNYLESAGFYGSRIVVEPWEFETLPDYFANLIVSDAMLFPNEPTMNRDNSYRLLRPWGGTVCLCSHENGERVWRKYVRGELPGAGSWRQQYCDPENTACSMDERVNGPLGMLWFGEPGPLGMVERHARAQSPVAMNGRLFMEGEELIMCADAFNGTLIWKREIPGAVRVKIKADSGNLVITENGLYTAAFDQCYRLDPATGETIRIYKIPPSSDGIKRRWGYLSVVDGVLYGSAAKAMNEEYGALVKAFIENGEWKTIDEIPEEYKGFYEAYKKQYPTAKDVQMAAQRSGALYRMMTSFGVGGEFTQKNAVTDSLMICDQIFAMDTETGEIRWTLDGEKIANITIAYGDGKIFFADAAVSKSQRNQALENKRRLIKEGSYKEREGVLEELRAMKKEYADKLASGKAFNKTQLTYLIDSLEAELYQEKVPDGGLTYDDADIRIVTAIDARTGDKLWEKPYDLTGCCGDRMGAAYKDGLLFFFGNHGNHDAWRFREGGLKWRRITALDADSGNLRWSRALNYRTRPVIVGDQIILEPRACDLYTGETITRAHPVTGEPVPWEFLRPGHTCGITAASSNGLFYRSACTAFYDLEKDRGVTLFGGYRPGCAISVIPACGVLLSQEAAAGCTCSYPIRCSLAMIRKSDRHQPWTVFVTPGELRPVKHLALNLGAAADMKDDEGTVWFSYPSPNTRSYTHFPNYGVKFNLFDKTLSGMGYYRNDFKGVTIDGTDKPWLFASGCLGLLRCKLPLLDNNAEEAPKAYTVRLGFKAMPGDKPGQRIFDIKIQDDIVQTNCDIHQIAGTNNKAIIKEFNNIQVKDDLTLELIPKKDSPRPEEAPLLNFVEVLREDSKQVSIR